MTTLRNMLLTGAFWIAGWVALALLWQVFDSRPGYFVLGTASYIYLFAPIFIWQIVSAMGKRRKGA